MISGSKTQGTSLIAVLAAVVLFLSACTNNGGENISGYTTSPNGLQYKIITDNKGAKGKDGDIIKFYSSIRTTKDSLIFSLSKLQVPQYGSVIKPAKKGDPIEVFSLLGKGDSASCLIPAEDFFKSYDLPAPLKKGDKVKLDIKVIDILTPEQYKQEMADMAAKHVDPQEQSIKDYIAKNNLQAQRLPDGLYYVIDHQGKGPTPVNGGKVMVNYTGRLLDGTIFDSSLDPGKQPFEFTLGQGMVIKGWDEGIPLFKVGGTGKLLIPASLGYGDNPSGKIPAGSVLVFDIQVLNFHK